MDPARSTAKLERLRQHLVQCGGSIDLIDGWQCVEVVRSRGNSAGSTDFYFLSAQGKRFRSQADVARHFGLAASSSKRSHTMMDQNCDHSHVSTTDAAAGSSSHSTDHAQHSPQKSPFFSRQFAQRPTGIVIGQAPPIHSGEDFVPLSGLAEQRLARLAGVEVGELWRRFDRRNLLDAFPGRKPRADKHRRENGYMLHQSNGDEFPKELAREAAAGIDLSGYGLAVLLGLQVAGAFRVKARLLTLDMETLACPAIVLPHTSGVSHFWNDADNVAAAEAAFRDAIAQCLGKRSRFFS